MALAGLELGVRDANYTTLSTGVFQISRPIDHVRDWKRGGHGRIDVIESLAQSVNTYYYQLALDLGIDRMHEFLSRFGFGAPTGVDLYGESGGILPSREWKRERFKQAWYPGETVIAGIGQGYNVATLLQLANATASIAAGGRRYQPRLVHALRASFDEPPRPLPSTLISDDAVRNPANLALIQRGLEAVLNSPTGTARAVAKGASYRMAGKTGTAQRVSRNGTATPRSPCAKGRRTRPCSSAMHRPMRHASRWPWWSNKAAPARSQPRRWHGRFLMRGWVGRAKVGVAKAGMGNWESGIVRRAAPQAITPESANDQSGNGESGMGNRPDASPQVTVPESEPEAETPTPARGSAEPPAAGTEAREATVSRQTRFPIPNSPFPIPLQPLRFPIPDSRFPIRNSRLSASHDPRSPLQLLDPARPAVAGTDGGRCAAAGRLLLLSGMSLAVVWSAGAQNVDMVYKQAMRFALGFALLAVCMRVPPSTWRRWTPWFYGLCIVLLLAVVALGEGKGAQRWLDLGVVRFQPSELLKLGLPMMLAWYSMTAFCRPTWSRWPRRWR